MTSVNSILFTITTAILLFILVTGAPVEKGTESKVAESNTKEETTAEKELQELADGEKALSRVPKVRGDTAETPDNNKKAVEASNEDDTKRSRAAALFKTRMLKGKQGNKRTPETVVKGPKIASRIPPSLRSQAKRPQQASDAEPALDVDLSPRAVAEYLLITSDFNGFETALGELQAAGIMSHAESKDYKNAVNWEYEGLLKKIMDTQASYGQVGEKEANVLEPQQVKRTSNKASGKPSSPDSAMDTPGVDLQTELKKLQLKEMMEREASLDQLLQAIMDDYYWRLMQQKGTGGATQNQDDKQLRQLMELLTDALAAEKSSEVKEPEQKVKAAAASKADSAVKEAPPQAIQPSATKAAKDKKDQEKKSEKRASA